MTIFWKSLPHARGGVSLDLLSFSHISLSSPRPWGCFPFDARRVGLGQVFPTPVGVFPARGATHDRHAGLPHARGGVSEALGIDEEVAESSPRPWGCFLVANSPFKANLVFPTPVGVFPPFRTGTSATFGLPHARGGVSQDSTVCLKMIQSSPRPWGCFHEHGVPAGQEPVFPTPVGVFPGNLVAGHQRLVLPHARGGVSERIDHIIMQSLSSPRPWGCFQKFPDLRFPICVFPTPVGVFPA